MSEQIQSDADYLKVDDPEFSIRSNEVKAAREKNWYARTPYGIAILRYAEVGKLIRDPRLRQGSYAWPTHCGVTTGRFAEWWGKMLLNLVGMDHARLRKLVNSAFSVKLVATLQPQFDQLAEELVDGWIDRGQCEFMTEFSEPYATRVVCMLLGAPQEDWKIMASWAAEIGLALGVTFKQDLGRIEKAVAELEAYAKDLIDSRRKQPREDFLTKLATSDALSEQELLDMVILLIFGGIDTTRNQLGLGVLKFMEHPEQWDLLNERPELAGPAVEEVMRVRPTVTWVTRETMEDIDFQGLHIPAKTTVHLFSESAGTDPRVTEAAFNIAATDRPHHFGFGMGPHHCLGHFIARADMGVVLRVLPKRITVPQPNGEITMLPDSGNTGPISLPIKFSKR